MNTPEVAGAPLNPLTSWSGLRRLLVSRRLALKLSQAAVAAKAGVGERTIQRWEARDAEPRALELLKWCSALGVSITPEVAG